MKPTDQIILEAAVIVLVLIAVALGFHIMYLRTIILHQDEQIRRMEDDLSDKTIKELTEQTWKN